MKSAGAVACAALLCGCAVTPEINYHLWNERPNGQAHDDSWVPYQLTDTTLVIGIAGRATPDSGGGGQSGQQRTGSGGGAQGHGGSAPPQPSSTDQMTEPSALLQPVTRYALYPISLAQTALSCVKDGCTEGSVEAAAVPIPYEGVTLGIEPASHWFIYTRMAPSYYPNSMRLKTLEFAVEDKRQEIIDTLGALAIGSARMAAPVPRLETKGFTATAGAQDRGKKLNLPVIIDLADAKKTLAADAPLPHNEGWNYHIRFMDDPAQAGFLRLAERDQVHRAVVTSLCRPVQITLTNGEVRIDIGVTVADPDYLLTIPLPPSGSVSFGTLCGADVQMQKAATVATDQLVTHFFNDVQSLRVIEKGGNPR